VLCGVRLWGSCWNCGLRPVGQLTTHGNQFQDCQLRTAYGGGVPLRVFVWHVDDEFGHLVNPTLDLGEEMQEGEEGCLSFPELSYETPRAMRAVAKGWNMHGEPLVVEGTEFLARALQHETDHLNGVLFIDRLPAELRKQAMKEIREAEWFLQSEANGASLEIKVSPHATFGRNL